MSDKKSIPRLPSTPEEVVAFIGDHFEVMGIEGPVEDRRITLTVHDLLSSFQTLADQAEEADTVAAQSGVVEVPEAVAQRTEEIRKMLANPEAIKRGKLVWAAECLLAHIALTNSAAPQPEAAKDKT